jgi:hypothetical protein
MKRIFPAILIIFQLISCSTTGDVLKGDSGTFRGKWYSYYERALSRSEKADWNNAVSDLKSSIARRSGDQRMARTYGMHFIDYFPHRELGIVYLNMGETDQAIRELETSIGQEKSAKAVFYLNKARKRRLLKQEVKPAPPEIAIHSPLDGDVLNDFTIKVKGKITGHGYVSKILINDKPYRFDLARQTVEFEKEVSLAEETKSIRIVSEDLLGTVAAKTISLTVDREGPKISVFDIKAEAVNGTDGFRITGEVMDRSGLKNLIVNGKTKVVNKSKSYEFDIVMATESLAGTFVIQASDILNNRTVAELDIEKELTALYEISQPILLASAADSLPSFDKKPPRITLKDTADVPAVFVGKYYVEGEVSDNRGVEEIMVNGREIETRKGRKIFFSKVVGLVKGSNSISIDAYDSGGNRARLAFTVKRNIPSALQVGSRMSVSVLPFDISVSEISLATLAYEQLIGAFSEQKRFRVIERTKLEQVLLEQKLTKEKLTDPEYSIKVGRIMAADTILATVFNETEKSLEFIARVINTETSEVMEVKDVYSEDKSFSSVKKLMDGLASKIAGSFPLVRGVVIRKDKKYVFTDLGTKEKIKRDMGLIVFRHGDQIRHPHTGRSLGRDTIKLGEARLEEIHRDFSKARVKEKPVHGNIAVQDMVITK